MKKIIFVCCVLLSVQAFFVTGCTVEAKKKRILERAATYRASDELGKARIEYLNLLQLDSQNATALEQLGLIWMELGAPERALPYLLKVREMSPGRPDVRVKIAQMTLSLGKLAEARSEAVEIIQRAPGHPDAVLLLTKAARTKKDYDVAEKELRNVSRDTAAYYRAAANLMLRRGEIEAARNALSRAVQIEPKSPEAHLELGSLYQQQNNLEKAEVEFRTAAGLAPLRSEARLRYAEFKAQTGAVPEAISSLNEITRQAPDSLRAWCALAQIALAQMKYDEALEMVGKVLELNSTSYTAQVLRAQVWRAKGDSKRAIEELDRVGRAFPALAFDKYQLALAHLQNNDPDRALTALKNAVAQNSDYEDAILLLAQLNLRRGDAQPVVVAMVELLQRRPNLLPAQLILIDAMQSLGRLEEVGRALREKIEASPQNAQLHYLLGLVLVRQEKFGEARGSLEKALELTPHEPPVIAELVALDARAGNFDQAHQRVRVALAKMPRDAALHFLEAKLYAAQGEWKQSEDALIKTIELDGNFEKAYELLRECFFAQRHQPQTIARLEDFLARKPDDLHALLLGGHVYLQLQEFAKARDAYEKYLSIKPNASLVLNDLAFLYAEHLGQLDRALVLARKARELEPKSPPIADTLGWVQLKLKDYAAAVELLEESAAGLPNNPEIQYHLALANEALGRSESARLAFQKALATTIDFPGKDQIEAHLRQLEGPAAPAQPGP